MEYYIAAIYPQYFFKRSLYISLTHTVRQVVSTIVRNTLVDHEVDYPRVRMFRPYEIIHISYEPDSIPPTPLEQLWFMILRLIQNTLMNYIINSTKV